MRIPGTSTERGELSGWRPPTPKEPEAPPMEVSAAFPSLKQQQQLSQPEGAARPNPARPQTTEDGANLPDDLNVSSDPFVLPDL